MRADGCERLDEADVLLLEPRRHFAETLRMTRNHHENRARMNLAHFTMRFEQQAFLDSMRAAGDPHRAVLGVLRAQLGALRLHVQPAR